MTNKENTKEYADKVFVKEGAKVDNILPLCVECGIEIKPMKHLFEEFYEQLKIDCLGQVLLIRYLASADKVAN